MFKCDDCGSEATIAHFWESVNHKKQTTVLFCDKHAASELEFDNSKIRPHLITRYERIHPVSPGDELSIAVECWLHQLRNYAELMPQLLERRAA